MSTVDYPSLPLHNPDFEQRPGDPSWLADFGQFLLDVLWEAYPTRVTRVSLRLHYRNSRDSALSLLTIDRRMREAVRQAILRGAPIVVDNRGGYRLTFERRELTEAADQERDRGIACPVRAAAYRGIDLPGELRQALLEFGGEA